MPETATTAGEEYDVAVKRESLRAWESTGTAYSIQLIGRIDTRWLAAFGALRNESMGFSRFHLDSTTKMVVFTCRAGDAPIDVVSVINMLESLVDLSNLYASGADGGLDHP